MTTDRAKLPSVESALRSWAEVELNPTLTGVMPGGGGYNSTMDWREVIDDRLILWDIVEHALIRVRAPQPVLRFALREVYGRGVPQACVRMVVHPSSEPTVKASVRYVEAKVPVWLMDLTDVVFEEIETHAERFGPRFSIE